MKSLGKSLLKRLTKYHRTTVPMHMPGHKRNARFLGKGLPYNIDITEIDGFDNLHDLSGVLKETADLASKLYGSKKAFPLVNGSTCGILASMYALASPKGSVLLSRNCHKSVYNGIELLNLEPHYIVPETDELGVFKEITPEAVENALKMHENISLVILTSPTYEGVISDISAISEVCKKYGAKLLLDAAHGAHLGLTNENKNDLTTKSGADVVVMSLHKTMPSLTQTALLHICSDNVDENKIKSALSVFETSSPSYPLLASIDLCIRTVMCNKEKLFKSFDKRLSSFYESTKNLKNIKVRCFDDPSKVIISCDGVSGSYLAEILRRKYKIEVEMACPLYCLAITSICDSSKNFKRLKKALSSMDISLCREERIVFKTLKEFNPEYCEIPSQAVKKQGEMVLIDDALGFESLEYLWAYPPGIPLIVPGEIITEDVLSIVNLYIQNGIPLYTTNGFDEKKIKVLKNNSLA
ncbi:MAG: aminotransferase class V-fold PLP-dependent enzyme [Clostridia bacterium]|nr:aminotransferase class V-fold PLP-dependent enzyme [Clostridia bacterium]